MFVSVWTFVTAGMLTFALIVSHTGLASEAGGAGSCTASSILLPCHHQ